MHGPPTCRSLLLFLALGICPADASAQADLAQLQTAFAAIDARLKAFAAASHAPGLAWGIVVDGELVHHGATGYRELATRTAVTPDTVFRIASMTKSFTALAILKLRDEGKLALDDPAEKYVPELGALQYPTADSPKITVRHLLSHAEGWPEDNAWGDRQLAVTDEELSEMMRRGIPFSNAPGVAYEYSNFGFAILGRIVSRLSGMRYAEYVAANILRPLGMTATTMEPAAVPAERLAHGYRWEDGTWKEEPLLPDGAFGPMGGMLTSMRDLARYVAFHLAAWPPRDEAETGPVRRASVREMHQVSRSAPAFARGGDGSTDALQLNAGGYGFGLRVWQSCDFPHLVAHSGGLPGFGSHMRWLPQHGVGMIVFANLTYTSGSAIVDEAFDMLARTGGLRARPVNPSPALTDAREQVMRLLAKWDDAVADRIAADNLFLDASKERRRRDIEASLAKHGECRPAGGFEVENALRGSWRMACERGDLEVAITLAPTMPPKVQVLEVRPFVPAAPTCRP